MISVAVEILASIVNTIFGLFFIMTIFASIAYESITYPHSTALSIGILWLIKEIFSYANYTDMKERLEKLENKKRKNYS